MEHETEAFADEAIPYEVVGVEAVGSLVESFGDLPADTRSGREVTVAGRLMRFRRQGRLAFGDLVDSSGKIQLLLRRETAA